MAEPVHDFKARGTGVSSAEGRIKSSIVKRKMRKKKKKRKKRKK